MYYYDPNNRNPRRWATVATAVYALLLIGSFALVSFDFRQIHDKPGDTITKFDLYTAGLSGRPDSAAKRAAFLEKLRFPAHMSANALLDALNLLYTREEFLALFEETT